MKKFKILFNDVLSVSKVTKTSKKKRKVLFSVILSNLIVFLDILIILTFTNIFISTSSYEGNPKAILEAMAAGCIVIAKSIPNNIEIINNLENGILFKDESELINILNNLTNIENQKNISSNAINQINKNNSLKMLSNNLFDDFKLLNNI